MAKTSPITEQDFEDVGSGVKAKLDEINDVLIEILAEVKKLRQEQGILVSDYYLRRPS